MKKENKIEWEIIERHEATENKCFGKKEYEVTFVLRSNLTGLIKIERFLLVDFNYKISEFYTKAKYISPLK